MRCFCPLSAMAAKQGPGCGRRSHARMAGLSPLLMRKYSSAAYRWLHMRSVVGGLPAITVTHASHTYMEFGARTLFCPVKLLPIQSATEAPRVVAVAQT